jgi:copper chaperone NosL
MPRRRWGFGFIAVLAWLTAGCGGGANQADEAPVLDIGAMTCAACGMTLQNPTYAAAARDASGKLLAFDSIECAVQHGRRLGGADETLRFWLPDFDTDDHALHPAESMTVVKAGYPSPMGGGYAAFLSPDRAAAEASARGGIAGSLEAFILGTARKQP